MHAAMSRDGLVASLAPIAAARPSWRNWGRTFHCVTAFLLCGRTLPSIPLAIFSPTTVEQCRLALELARRDHHVLRVVDIGHLPSNIADSSYYTLNMTRMNRIIEVNTIDCYVVTEAGITLADLRTALAPHRLAIRDFGSISDRTLASIVATATHSAGSQLAHFLALTLLLPSNEIVSCSPTERRDLFDASLCGLGATGIILLVTIKLEPSFSLRDVHTVLPVDKVVRNLDIIKTSGSFKVPPTPHADIELYVEADSSMLLNLTGQVRREGSYPLAHGGFADVWKGVWDRQPDRWVAIKVLRSPQDDPQKQGKMNKRLARELCVWKQLDHKHVLKLLGTVSDFGPYDSMVSPWLEQGSVSKYMERCGDILSMTDRLQLLCEVADGLHYLHENSIGHGDLTGSNILIDDEGKVKLCDFGLSTIVAEICGNSSLTSNVGGAVRWADPALFALGNSKEDDSMPAATTRRDIYSYGSVMLEILSGRIPFHYIKRDAQVICEIHQGNKPRRPTASFVTDAQWELIMRCWAADVDARPDAAEIVRAIQALHRASLECLQHLY